MAMGQKAERRLLDGPVGIADISPLAQVCPIADDRCMTAFADHDVYIAAAPEALRPLLMLVRARLAQTLPDVDEVIQYDMPGFGSAGLVIAGYAAFSKQCGLYVSKGAISAYSDDIAAAGLKASKTGVTFSPSKPIPDELITALALASRKELGV